MFTNRATGIRLAVAVSLSCWLPMGDSRAAPPERDPKGWGDVRFGMTQEEVIKALDGKAHIEPPRAGLAPLMKSPTVADLHTAITKAKSVVDDATDEGSDDDEEVLAAKQLLKLIKPRKWRVIRRPEVRRIGQPAIVIDRQFMGTLEDFNDLAFHGRDLVVRPTNKRHEPQTLSPATLDKDSTEYLAKVDQAVSLLSDILANEALKAPASKDGRLVIAPVEVRGIVLQPDIEYEGRFVSRINLSTPGADNPMTPVNPARFGLHRTICDALAQKFGPSDERNSLGNVDVVVWRFPETLIKCSCSRFGVEIVYERATKTNASGGDDL
jgi:hypothetical protein